MSYSFSFANNLIAVGNMCLLAVFALAASAKLRHTDRARAGLISFGVPAAWALPALAVLVLVEVLIVASLAYPPTRLVGAGIALGALTIFTLAITWQLLRGRRPSCACFGALSQGTISWKTVGRNLGLIALAGGLIALPTVSTMPLPRLVIPWPVLGSAVWIGVSITWLLLLTRQNGRLLGRIQQLEHTAQRVDTMMSPPPTPVGPLQVGDPVPPLGLSDAHGRPFDPRSLRGSPGLMLFLDATCGHCRPLLAYLRAHQPLHSTVVVISADAALRQELPASITLLVDPPLTSVALFGARGTPAAVLLDADGRLAQPVVHGTTAIRTLLDQLTPQEVRHEWASV